MSSSQLHRVAVALDTSDFDEFRRWCKFFGPRVGVLKVGLECFCRFGPPAVEEARRHARRVFLDLKLHDIPNTVAGAVRSAEEMGVDLLTVHAGGGRRMLEAAAADAKSLQILAVTLLTHLDAEDLDALDLEGPASLRVSRWAELARAAGASGAVCSPRELESLRSLLPAPFLLVTPGIRPEGASQDDQRRTATPGRAIDAGADLLVIGRPLTRADDAEKTLVALDRELSRSGI